MRLADTSRFGENVWYLKQAQMQRHQTEQVLNFERVPEPFRRTAKEISFVLLRGDLPPGCESIRSIDSIRAT